MAASLWWASDSSDDDGRRGRAVGDGRAPAPPPPPPSAGGSRTEPDDPALPAPPPPSDREVVRLPAERGDAASDAAVDRGSPSFGTRAHRDGRADDAELVRAVLGGDVDAFGPLVERYQHDYVRFARRMLGSHDDADEALQAAFLRAYRALAQCRDPQRFGAWLYHIFANECRTRATRGGRRERRFLRDEATLERASVDHPADDGALRDEIQHALDQLPEDQREAFVLKHVEDLSYDEMAEITGAGVSALKMRVKRACERLRDLLVERVYA